MDKKQICTMCGKEFNEWDESFHTGNFDLFVGYGSKYDDERIQFSLCIDCFDRMMDTILPLFKINPIVDNSWTDHCTSDHLRHKSWGPGGKPYREDVTARIIVECGRDFADYGRLKEELDCVVTGYERAEIISGIEKGMDLLAEKYAKEKCHSDIICGMDEFCGRKVWISKGVGSAYFPLRLNARPEITVFDIK